MNAFALQAIKESLSTPRTFSELLEMTSLPRRTLSYNLAILKRDGWLSESHVFSDMRKRRFNRR